MAESMGVLVRARWGLLGAAGIGAVVLVAACSVSTESAGSGKVGAICSSASDCSTNACLEYTDPNDQNIKGQCSKSCSMDSDCPSGSVCALKASSGTFCGQTCASNSACPTGVPCVYDSTAGTGTCHPILSSLCSNLASSGNTCLECASASCCQQLKACVADYACGQAFLGTGSSSSTSSLYMALTQCLGTPCASCFGATADDAGTD
jgi:hypothetical protein